MRRLLVERLIERSWPVARWLPYPTLVAVSGGPDSTALACALQRLGASSGGRPHLVIAHVNHGWRGEQSEADARSVAQLAQELGMPFLMRRSQKPDSGHGVGWEAQARRERYRLLVEMADQVGARYVATAHTWNDQVETVLGRILRGTGVEGLAGIPRHRRLQDHITLVRPMLGVTRQQVLRYLSALGRSWQEDETNRDERFLRGYLRVTLLPTIRQRFGARAEKSLARLARDAAAWRRLLDPVIEQRRMECLVECGPDEVVLRANALAALPALLCRLVLRRQWQLQGWPERNMTRRAWVHLGRICRASAPTTVSLPGEVQASRRGELLYLRRPAHLTREEASAP